MATNQQIPFPAKLNLSANLATEWKRFHSQWTNYCVATDLTDQSMKKRTATFLAIIGNEAYELFQSMDLSESDREDLDTVVEKFREYCIGEINVTYERYILNRRLQDANESFDTFLADVRRLIKSCEYGTLEESIIRDRIVMGINSDTTRRKLLSTRNLTLNAAIDTCRASELAAKQLKDMTGADAVERLDAKPQRPGPIHRGRSKSRSRYETRTESVRVKATEGYVVSATEETNQKVSMRSLGEKMHSLSQIEPLSGRVQVEDNQRSTLSRKR